MHIAKFLNAYKKCLNVTYMCDKLCNVYTRGPNDYSCTVWVESSL